MSNTTPKLPEVKFNKSGYEIRAELLGLAKDMVMQDYSFKFQGWEMASRKSGNEVVTTVSMPEFPGIDKVLEAAEKMYGFVNQTGSKK